MIATVEGSALALIKKYRLRAVFIAMDRLNKSIDRGDLRARAFWAQVVHAIHDYQRSGQAPADADRPGSSASPPNPSPGSAQQSARSTTNGRRGMVGAGGN